MVSDKNDLIVLTYHDLVILMKTGVLMLVTDNKHKRVTLHIEPRDQDLCRRLFEKGQADL